MPSKSAVQANAPMKAILEHISNERRSIVMKEWGGAEVWFGKLVANDMLSVEERSPKNHIERNLILLTMKAENKDGTPLFGVGDLHALKSRIPWTQLSALIAFMYESMAMGGKEAAAAVAENPPSSGT